MDIIKELREGDKVVLKKVEDLPKDAKKDEIEDYSKFAGKTVTVNTILKRTNDNVFFDIKEDKDSYDIANVIVCAIKNFDELSTKEHSFGVGVIEKVLPREETNTNKTKTDETKEHMSRVMSDFIGFLNTHYINGTALYQEFKKEVKVSE